MVRFYFILFPDDVLSRQFLETYLTFKSNGWLERSALLSTLYFKTVLFLNYLIRSLAFQFYITLFFYWKNIVIDNMQVQIILTFNFKNLLDIFGGNFMSDNLLCCKRIICNSSVLLCTVFFKRKRKFYIEVYDFSNSTRTCLFGSYRKPTVWYEIWK